MDIEKLIEQLRKSADFEDYPIVASFAAIIEKKYLRDAATALSTLQAENEKLRGYINDLETQHRTEMCENGYDCVELGKLRAELEQVKRERDSALKDLERLCRDDVGPCEMAICELCAYNSGVQCSSSDRQICDGYNVFNWKWRGPQKED